MVDKSWASCAQRCTSDLVISADSGDVVCGSPDSILSSGGHVLAKIIQLFACPTGIENLVASGPVKHVARSIAHPMVINCSAVDGD